MPALVYCDTILEAINSTREKPNLSHNWATIALRPYTSQVESVSGKLKLFPSWAIGKRGRVGRPGSSNILQRHTLKAQVPSTRLLLPKGSATSLWHTLETTPFTYGPIGDIRGLDSIRKMGLRDAGQWARPHMVNDAGMGCWRKP